MAPTLSSRWFIAGFAIVMALTAIFSWQIFSRVQDNVVVADRGVHVVAWALLLHADRHGAFPDDAESLVTEPWAERLETLISEVDAWPTTFAAADAGARPQRGGDWSSRLRAALEVVSIQRSRTGEGPPRLSTPGFPTSLGALDTVNGWLAAADASLSK